VASPTCLSPLTNFPSGLRPVLSPASGLSKLCYFFTDIVHRFGVPNCIITDNDTQFTGKKFMDFCDNHHIRVLWSAVAHLKTNGQVERANEMVLQGLKPRIFDKLKKYGKK
jgi:transposase InsO family protein